MRIEISTSRDRGQFILRALGWMLLPLAYITIVRWFGGDPISAWTFINQAAFIAAVLILSSVMRIHLGGSTQFVGAAALIALISLLLLYMASMNTLSAWALVALGFAVLIRLQDILSSAKKVLPHTLIDLLLALIAGSAAVLLLQIEERFSEEEFYAALQVGLLSGLWFLLNIADRKIDGKIQVEDNFPRNERLLAGAWLAAFCIASALIAVRSYQQSFSPSEGQAYPGISQTAPFVCGQVDAPPSIYQGEEVYARLLKLVEANPQKGVLEYGLLAYATEEPGWADLFRESLLDEARLGQFTGPENSVKYGQCLAARRAYFYDLVEKKYSSLFNVEEKKEIESWYSAINRRAFSLGWVDWLYTLAFNTWPKGPYENQECGAGLIAILEATGLADPALSTQNRAYLAERERGWSTRFRNSDDTYAYQVEWMQHSWFMALLAGQADTQNAALAFEWFLLQVPPDGSPLGYNQIRNSQPTSTAWWASAITSTESFIISQVNNSSGENWQAQALWLAGRSVDYLESNGMVLNAQVGMDLPSSIVSQPPTWGSCLIFGESGVPTQVGPLAADKVVFRDGWEDGSSYLLLNLRFTGWHRYRATNTVILAYQDGPLLVEANTRQSVSWLPRGRAQMRDKRLPRENLNGMLVERSALSKVVWDLTGVGSRWAQDPPFFARIELFETGLERDSSTTVIDDWRGWTQARRVYFQHQGPTVIVDQVSGVEGQAAIAWQFPASITALGEGQYRIRDRQPGVNLLLLRADQPLDTESLVLEENSAMDGSRLMFMPADGEGFTLVTVLLPENWQGAQAEIIEKPEGQALTLSKANALLDFPLPSPIDP